MPQVPALDRVPRPQIDARGVLAGMQALGDASQRKPVDERPFVAAAGAKDEAMGVGLKATGDVLMNVSSVLGALAQKRQQAHEDRQIQQFHADMRQENERRLAYQAATPDSSKWRADAQSGAQRVSKPYENAPGVSAGVQQQLKGTAATFKTMTDIDTQARVDKAGFADTARAYAENIDATIEFGDYDTSDGLIEEGGKRGYFSKAQMQGMLAHTAQRRREDQLMSVVKEHPQEAPGWFAQEDKLTEYKLTPLERREWEHRAQSFWEDHERQSVGEVLDGMHHGEITAVKQLEHWKPDMGPKAYADLSEMLAARRPSGIAKNDSVLKEQTIATIANVQVRPEEVDSQIGLAKLGEDIKNTFTGGNRQELLSRLEARVKSPDAGRESMLGPALAKLNQWGFGTVSLGHEATGNEVAANKVSATRVTPMALAKGGAPQEMAEQVRTIREDLEDANKAGKIKTKEDALDFVTRKVTALGWGVTGKPSSDVAGSSGHTGELARTMQEESDPWSAMLELQERQRKRGEELRSQGEFSGHSNEENERNYRDEEWLKEQELEEFGKKHSMSPEQIKTLQDDIDKVTKNWADGWFTKADRARILSDGRIVVNPSLYLAPYEYVDAVVKSGGSTEEQRRALSALPGLRAQASQQLYDALMVLAPVKEFLDQQPGDVTHKIAALIEEQQRHPIWNKLTGQLGAGADDVAAAGIGLLAMASGQTARVEKLFGKSPMEGVTRWLEQWASYATQRGAAIDRLSNLSKTDRIIDATGHLVRMAPDLMAMEATGGLARGTLQAARVGRVVEAGTEAAEALNAAGQTAGAAYFGTRSAGATYLEALQAGLDTGKSPEEARADALAPALATGVLSYATFSTGGTKALTNIFRSEVATRELLEHGFKAFAQDLGVTMGVGGMQMGLDSLAHDIVAQRSYHPELTDEQILANALNSGLTGAAFAGFTRTVQGAAAKWQGRGSLPSNPGAVDYTPLHSINPAHEQPANTRTMGRPINVPSAEHDFLSGYADTLPKDKDGKAPAIISVAAPQGVETDIFAKVLAKAFGREVGWYEGPENHSGTIDPKTGKIWLNAKSPESFAPGIVADEGIHWMKQAHPDVYNSVLDHFQGLIKDNKVDQAFGKWLEDRGYDFGVEGPDGRPILGRDGKPVMDASRMNEEMLGHLGKDMVKDPEFWTATFQHNPGLGRRFIARLRDFVSRTMDKLKEVTSSGRDASSFLKGREALESMRDNLATAYANMIHLERAAEVAKRFPDDLDWPKGPDGKPVKTAPDIPIVRAAPDGRKRPGERDKPVANQGLSHRAYSDRTESEQARIDADLKPYERFHQVTDLWSVTTGDARRAIVDAAKNYKGGDTSFRTHVANLFNDPKFVDKPDFGAYLYYHFGAPDADMAIPHGHHITYKKWIEEEGGVVKEIHDILNGVGINPIVGLENLIQAPNVEGQHSTQKLREMANELRTLKNAGGNYADFVDTLGNFGEESRNLQTERSTGKSKAPKQ